MAGVAEFTMGLGLLWTPLVRRLSALALFLIFNAAVYPFGRIDLVGHALIMGVIVAIAADHGREPALSPWMSRTLASVPVGLMLALLVFTTSYWGLHRGIYGEGGGAPAAKTTHTHDAENPHADEP